LGRRNDRGQDRDEQGWKEGSEWHTLRL
jgi:hypothetical protein